MEQVVSKITVFVHKTLTEFFDFYANIWFSSGIIVLLLFLIILFISSKFFNKSKFYLFFEMFYEKIYEFFEDILGKEENKNVKMYVTWLFFVILFSNLFWTFTDIILPAFNTQPIVLEEWLKLEHFVAWPTTVMSFDIAMAIVTVLFILIVQAKHLWIMKFFHEYVPILWKNFIPYERWNLKPIFDIPVFLFVKLFDIIISLFLWFLDIIGMLAKVISLSFRLFWNVTSWSILLMMMVWGLIWLSQMIASIDFPIVFPLIIYAQGILVSLVQAFVFSLLTTIFIKVSKVS